MSSANTCKGCQATVRVSQGELDRILAGLHLEQAAQVDDAEYRRRLAECQACAALEYGTTCRFCGCLVQVRAKLEEKHCPRPDIPAW